MVNTRILFINLFIPERARSLAFKKRSKFEIFIIYLATFRR